MSQSVYIWIVIYGKDGESIDMDWHKCTWDELQDRFRSVETPLAIIREDGW